jgi:hypothetical protein
MLHSSGASTGKPSGSQLDTMVHQAAVYGTFSAVQLADSVLLQRLAEPLRPLLQFTEMQQVPVSSPLGVVRR